MHEDLLVLVDAPFVMVVSADCCRVQETEMIAVPRRPHREAGVRAKPKAKLDLGRRISTLRSAQVRGREWRLNAAVAAAEEAGHRDDAAAIALPLSLLLSKAQNNEMDDDDAAPATIRARKGIDASSRKSELQLFVKRR